jgi:transmembrane sensor
METPPPPGSLPPVDDALIDRYVAGECLPSEVDHLLEWMGTDPARQEVVRRAQLVWDAARRLPGQWDADGAWERANLAIHSTRSDGQATGAIGESVREAGRVHLLGASHQADRGRPTRNRVPRLAAAACFGIGLLAVGWRFMAIGKGARSRAESIITGPRQRVTVQLRDGSRVVLAPESRLVESPAFGVGTREIELEGAAYFDVAHDPAKPFVVITRDLRIRDLGTRFAVDAYTVSGPASDSTNLPAEARVAVTAGSVELEALENGGPSMPGADLHATATSRAIVVGAGHVGRLDRRGRITVERPSNINQYVTWTTSDLTFDDVPFSEAISRLERWYGVRIVLGDGLACRHITATFRDQSLDQVLDELSLALHARRTSVGESVTLEASDVRSRRPARPGQPLTAPGDCAAGTDGH